MYQKFLLLVVLFATPLSCFAAQEEKIDVGKGVREAVEKSAVLEAERISMVTLVQGLIAAGMYAGREESVKSVINALADIPANERHGIVELVKKIDQFNTERFDAGLVIDLLQSLPDSERPQMVRLLNQLSHPGLKIKSRNFWSPKLFNALIETPYNQRQAIVGLVISLIQPEMPGARIGSLINSLLNVPVDQRAEIVEQVKIFSFLSGVHYVLKVLAAVPRVERQGIVDLIKPLILLNVHGFFIGKMITSLAEDPVLERQEIIDLTQELIQLNTNNEGSLESRITQYVEVLKRVPVDERREFVSLLKNVTWVDLKREWFAENLAKIKSPSDRQAIIQQVQYLQEIGVVNTMHMVRILYCYAEIHGEYQLGLAEQINKFIEPGITFDKISVLITGLGNVDVAERPVLIEQLKQLLAYDIYDFHIRSMIPAMQAIPATERSRRLARALLFLNGRIKEYGRFHAANMIAALETPLQDELWIDHLPEIVRRGNPYAAGLNVHTSDRDARAIKSVQALFEIWAPTPAEIDEAYHDFLLAVKKLDPVKRSRVLRSLGVDEEGNTLPTPAGENFAGLVSGVSQSGEFSLFDNTEHIRVNGREVIARFWHFANTYQDRDEENTSKDQENMRKAIMNALSSGVAEDNKLRCEMGRVQFLAVATLQGRLKDKDGKVVDVDGLGLNTLPQPQNAPAGAVGPHAPAPDGGMITNLSEIANYVRPFVQSLGSHIETAEQFYQQLFMYLNRLAKGHVMADNTRILLDPALAVYYVRMIEPAVHVNGRLVSPARINPHGSLVDLLGFGDAFRVDDYLGQFGDHDQLLFNEVQAAQAEQERRELREQQDQEFAAAQALDIRRQKAATDIQRVVRGSMVRERLRDQKRIDDIKAAILKGEAGAMNVAAEDLDKLSHKEKDLYVKQRRVHQFSK